MFQFIILLIGLAIIGIVITVLLSRQRSSGRQNIPIARILPLGLAAVAGIAALIVSLTGGMGKGVKEFSNSPGVANTTRSSDVKLLFFKVDSLEKKIDHLFKKILLDTTNAKKAKLLDSIPLSLLNRLSEKIDKNSQAISNFEALLITDSERLIALPIVLHDLQSLKDDVRSVEQNLGSIYTIINETNEQNRWVLGTLAFGLLSLVLTAVFSNVGVFQLKRDSERQQNVHKE